MTNPFEGKFEKPAENPFLNKQFGGWGPKPAPWWQRYASQIADAFRGMRREPDLVQDFLQYSGANEVDALLGAGQGIMAWPAGKAAGLTSLAFDAFGEVPPEIAADRARLAEEDVAGMFYAPQTQVGQQTVEQMFAPIEKVLHGVRTLANVEGDLYAPLGIQNLKGTHPRIAYVAEIAADLMTFKAGHVVGARAVKKLQKLNTKVREKEMTSEEALAEFEKDFTPEEIGTMERLRNIKKPRHPIMSPEELARVAQGEAAPVPPQRTRHPIKSPEELMRQAYPEPKVPPQRTRHPIHSPEELTRISREGLPEQPMQETPPSVFSAKEQAAVEKFSGEVGEKAPRAKKESPKTLKSRQAKAAKMTEDLGYEITYQGHADGLSYFDIRYPEGKPQTVTVRGAVTEKKVRSAIEKDIESRTKDPSFQNEIKEPTAREQLAEIEEKGTEVSADEAQRLIREAEKEAQGLTIDEAEAQLRELFPEFQKIIERDPTVDLDAFERKVRQISDEFAVNPIDEARGRVLNPSDKMLTEVNRARNESTPKELADELVALNQKRWDLSQEEWSAFVDELKTKSVQDIGAEVRESVGIRPDKVEPTKKLKARKQSIDRIMEEYQNELSNDLAGGRGLRDTARDVYEVFVRDLVEENRGSISFDKMAPEVRAKKRQALKRLMKDAERLGRSLVDHMRTLKLPEDVIRAAERERKVMEGEQARKGLEKLDTSDIKEVINPPDKTAVDSTGREYKVESIKILPEELAAVKAIPNKSLKFFETRPFDIYKPLKEIIYRPLKAAERLMFDERKRFKGWLREQRKTVTHKSGRRIGIDLIADQKGGKNRPSGKDILDQMGIKSLPKLTEAEKAVKRALRRQMENFYDRINNARAKMGLEKFKKREDYFTFLQDVTLLERMGIQTRNIDVGTLEALRGSHFRFAQERLKDFRPIDLNAFRVMEQYANTAYKHIYISPVTMKARALIENIRYKNAEGKARNYSLKQAKPDAYEAISTWINDQVRQAPEPMKNPTANKAVNWFNRNFVTAILAGNIRSILVQLSAHRGGMTHHPISHLQGVVEVGFNPRIWKEVGEKSKIVPVREGTAIIEEFGRAMQDGLISAPKKMAADVGMLGLKVMDAITARMTWQGAYRAAQRGKLKMTEQEMRNFADDFVVKTQGSGTISDLSPLQRKMIGRMFTTFQTFVINDFNWLLKDVLGVAGGEKMSVAKRAGMIAKFAVATALVNSFYEDVMNVPSPYPTPVRTYTQALEDVRKSNIGKTGSKRKDPHLHAALLSARELVEPIPIIGGGIRYGGGVSGVLLQNTEAFLGNPDVISVFNKVWEGEEITNGDITKVSNLAKLLGVPYTAQIAKSLKQYKKDPDDYWAIVTGGNPKVKERKVKVPQY